MVKEIRIEDFDYPLPDDRIPRHPLAERDTCLLMVSHPGGRREQRRFDALPQLLEPGTLLVRNETKVINARIKFRKPTGALIEVFLLEPVSPADYVLNFQARGHCSWACMVGNLKRWKDEPISLNLTVEGGIEAVLTATRLNPLAGNAHEVEFSWTPADLTFATILQAAGQIPIPPYLKRESEESDSRDYQTVYARAKGSVAAPTAGLHFTDRLFGQLAEKGVETLGLTLHVGAGTFQPVKSENIGDHPMHTETFTVSRTLVEKLIRALETGRPVAAVGTTTVRTLESLPHLGAQLMAGDTSLHVTQWEAYEPDRRKTGTLDALKALLAYMEGEGTENLTASTAIMIAPGFDWRTVGVMVTNFHQPQSTLLLLVSSFLGSDGETPRWRPLYDEALEAGFRFLSYGDACLLFRNPQNQ